MSFLCWYLQVSLDLNFEKKDLYVNLISKKILKESINMPTKLTNMNKTCKTDSFLNVLF